MADNVGMGRARPAWDLIAGGRCDIRALSSRVIFAPVVRCLSESERAKVAMSWLWPNGIRVDEHSVRPLLFALGEIVWATSAAIGTRTVKAQCLAARAGLRPKAC